jgi:predicted acetyltransferase
MASNGNGTPTGMLIVTIDSYKQVVAYLLMVAVMIVGFALIEAEAGQRNSEDRAGCERTNVVRDNQWQGIKEQVDSTEATLKQKNGLGPLEPFREQIVEQNEKRKVRQRRLLVEDHPQLSKPWLTDCRAAHP